MSRAHYPGQMVSGLARSPLCAPDERQVIVRVNCIAVAPERLHEMICGLFILAAAIIRDAQRDVRGGKARITPERFLIRSARRALVALFVESHSFYVRLF